MEWPTTEADIDPIDKTLAGHLSTIGRICAIALTAAGVFLSLAIYFKSPVSLLAVAAAMGVVALTLRTGEVLFRRHKKTHLLVMSEED